MCKYYMKFVEREELQGTQIILLTMCYNITPNLSVILFLDF